MCGEHVWTPIIYFVGDGSSPRVRGTFHSKSPIRHRCRFIPACAGNISLKYFLSRSSAVHPRVCGEHPPQPRRIRHETGSSPRVRGTCTGRRGVRCFIWFIPACAGNIPGAPLWPVGSTVHPRVCGEHSSIEIRHTTEAGSSPRVRGTFAMPNNRQKQPRFIPACAGNIMRASITSATSAVHPRVCGEHAASRALTSLLSGSSPRVRGTCLAWYCP